MELRGRSPLTIMPHLILLGDSIFDNAAYVPAGGSAIERLQKHLPTGFRSTLLAVDGAIACDLAQQLSSLPADSTHLALSVGGNDALGASGVLMEGVMSVADALEKLALVQTSFRRDYVAALGLLQGYQLPTVVCTIYDAVPGLDTAAQTALNLFNDVILRSATAFHADVLDLRLLCNEAADYSAISPIEPSAQGAEKIAQRLAEWASGSVKATRLFY